MECKLHSWFVSLRNRHVPVSSEFLATKAKHLYAKYYGDENFNANRGWIANFRKSSLKKCWKTILKQKNENDLEDDPEDLIPLSVMRQKIRSLAEEIDAVSSMLHCIGNVDIDVGKTIDWIDSDAKLIKHENLIHANDSADSDDDVMETATPFRIKNEDAVKSLNLSLQWGYRE
ncbi:hypothetical protein NQ314_017202 [Rhamnusium bicolor]|uniref:HTH CENPB-type domain-containing protein n=1 Tax=Rhamnusium bicolor TaxID=1586634 RepID=A0AAV8WUW5_9CUCU|nr:hypothetical protein NQ314_017202 [Rhamnusium bicolor]